MDIKAIAIDLTLHHLEDQLDEPFNPSTAI